MRVPHSRNKPVIFYWFLPLKGAVPEANPHGVTTGVPPLPLSL